MACALLCLPGTALALDSLDFRVEGAESDLTDSLRNASLLVAAETEKTTDPQELLAAALADYGRLEGSLYSEGRFGGGIHILIDGREAASIPPLNPPERISRIEVQIQPGPQYVFAETTIAPQAPETEVPEEFATGQPARTPVIRDAVAAVVDGWRNVGRAKAEVGDQRVVADHAANDLGVNVGIRPGPVVRFGKLILKGGESVRDARLRKIASLPTNDIYDPEDVQKVATRLRRTGVFRAVAVTEAETLGPGDTMDIIATLDEQKPRRIGAGAEYSTTEGLRLTGYWLHRNLLGGAERLSLDGEISGIGGGTGGVDYKFSARYGRPATPNADTDLFVLAEIERLDEPEYLTERATLGFGFTRYVNDRLTLDAGLSYRFSRDTDAIGTTKYNQILLPISAKYDSRDEPLNATKGYFADATVRPFVGVAGSDSGVRLTFDTRAYLGLGATDRVVLAGRLQGGSILGASLTGVPNDDRFYSGGGGTVRGQDYQSLGVQLTPDFLSGGKSFAVASAEVRTRVTDSIGLVGFADFGIVSDDSYLSGNSGTHGGAGLGLRYLTPIGPIRLDVAVPVGGTSNGVAIYVGIGQAF
ncbi:autotransporter assembly complex protein TamA [Oceaniglobus roseus]|uniref:autotransporter assembly complex protein TamA n=1 Tax=Oceaniglobus roseus TaxID=1737570 RepID=UPI001562842C|nr:autotransporter assembly complex family protein [Kandeliimicrobium roseum]